ncbi:hypothetical protein [Xanthomonas phage f20-Xaj]|uniref:Tail fiber protein n=1 Tax=Xanthomonas phage f20-Xaj TaxID=1784979 RepID=A0A127AWR4_9CAUD|nr:tail fiber protein [Xanthomonas phage f20-Xaj]AMM44634.1 hypothetical protein [Xanthomonas phage f20-Xaj]
MANPFLLYGRPLSTDEVELPLSVTGELEGYTATEAYEGRLQINNAIGRCRVEILESTAPVGLVARVDNITKEVVLKWDAYTVVEEEIKLLPNGSFEDGDDGTWRLGKGWTIENDPANAKDGSWTAKFDKFKTDGSDLNMFRIPAKINDYIRLTADVKQGGSSSGSVGARVTLVFHDLEGRELLIKPGNLVVSGKDGEWKETSTEAGAPTGTAYVYAVVSAYRHAQNRPMWVDNVRWNHKYTLGQNDDDSYFVRLKVTDSANRVAYWSGDITEFSIRLTSTPYPALVMDDMTTSAQFLMSNGFVPPAPLDGAMSMASFQQGLLETLVAYKDYTVSGDEFIVTSGQFVSGNLEVLVSYEDYTVSGNENIQSNGQFRSGTMVIQNINRDLVESTRPSAQFISGVLV